MEGPGLQKLQRLIREARERAAEKKDEKSECDQLSDGGNVPRPSHLVEKELKRKRKRSEKIVLETDLGLGTSLAVPGFTNESESPAELEETPVAKRKKKQINRRETKELKDIDPRESRTIFVGNIPPSLSKKKVSKMFSAYGKVESVRMRSVVVAPGKLPVKVARKLGKQLAGKAFNCYVVMETDDEAKQCLELNGTEVEGRHLRVDMATPTLNNKITVFVGNLPFTTDEENLREAFR